MKNHEVDILGLVHTITVEEVLGVLDSHVDMAETAVFLHDHFNFLTLATHPGNDTADHVVSCDILGVHARSL